MTHIRKVFKAWKKTKDGVFEIEANQIPTPIDEPIISDQVAKRVRAQAEDTTERQLITNLIRQINGHKSPNGSNGNGTNGKSPKPD